MSELVFTAPDAGNWEQDPIHFPRPMTRFLQETFRDGFIRGFKVGTTCYGLLLDHLQPEFVNHFIYTKPVIVGAPPNAKGPPPRLICWLMTRLHPETRRRLKSAATVLQEKPWREHIKNWDTVLKPTSTANHLRLQAIDLATLSDAALFDHLKECFENAKAMVFQHHIYTITCGITVCDFMACTREWTGLSASEISQALRGSTPISSGVTDEYLAALRAIETDVAAVAILVGPGQPLAFLQKLQDLPGSTGAAIKTYLALVAHRVTGGYDISCPTAIETPEVMVKALQVKHSPREVARSRHRVQEQTARIRAAVPEAHRTAFDEVLAEARLVNRLRDERGHCSDLCSSGISRRALLEIGRRLLVQGKIHAAEHVLDATCDEACALLSGSGNASTPSAIELAARHQYRVGIANDVAPPFLNGMPSPPPPLDWFPENTRRVMRAMGVFMSHLKGSESHKSEDKTVRGISVSVGVYEGRARVIDNIDSLNQIQQGEVLVTRSTSAAFNFVLPLVGVIVTDRGGLMSHAAIVAREYGLPAVVGCQVATKMIPDGAQVRVNADQGEVTIVS